MPPSLYGKAGAVGDDEHLVSEFSQAFGQGGVQIAVFS